MPTTGQPDKRKYYDAWAKMMITIWEDKIIKLNVRDTGELLSSFEMHVEAAANGEVAKIVHTYNYYGRMVDMGVGRGVSKADSGQGSGGRAKPWYNKSYYHSVKVLSEKTAELYGEQFQAVMFEALNF